MKTHRPPHIYLDDQWYFLTASVLDHHPILRQYRHKLFLRDCLKNLVEEYDFRLKAWVILDNHYHLLLKTCRGLDLSRFFARLHASTSKQFNVWDGASGRQVWYSYWDSCIRGEGDFWTHFNYVHYNPVKHGYVQDPAGWEFSSYSYYLRTKGGEWLNDCWRRYPVLESVEHDG
jgi:putative transposase